MGRGRVGYRLGGLTCAVGWVEAEDAVQQVAARLEESSALPDGQAQKRRRGHWVVV